MHPELQFLVRLLVAAALAAALGWERERARKSAGLRTHMLVGLEHYVLAVGATALLLFVLRVLVRFDAPD